MKEVDEIKCELDHFYKWNRAFTLSELTMYIDPSLNFELFCEHLQKDERFIFMESNPPNDNYYISKKALIKSFVYLNFRLAKYRLARLTPRELAHFLSFKRFAGKWDIPPDSAICFATRFGLVSRASTIDEYVFPLANILIQLPKIKKAVVHSAVKNLCYKEFWQKGFKNSPRNTIDEVFTRLKDRMSYIIRSREGLLDSESATLELLGSLFNTSRERIRQIEEEFWAKYSKNTLDFGYTLLKAFLSNYFLSSGQLIVKNDDIKGNEIKFICKCCGIKYSVLPTVDLTVIGVPKRDFNKLNFNNLFPDYIDKSSIIAFIEKKRKIILSKNDLNYLATKLEDYIKGKLNFKRRAFLALREIGRPAHYSEVTDTHNELFPDNIASENQIHGALTSSKYGVVWIGIKGTFALKKWGYEKPSKTLHQSVREIVEKKYREAARPVHISVIISEMSEYRKMVKPQSIFIVASSNPYIMRVNKEYFVPKTEEDEETAISLDELNKIFLEIREEDKSQNSRGMGRRNTLTEGVEGF